MSLLITGSTGILGKELKKIFPDSVCPTHNELDITNENAVNDFFASKNIDSVIHTAAITSIRICDEENQLSWKTNVDGTKNLINALKQQNDKGYFIFISTACVFHGDEKMYTEKSIPNPVNFYAMTKLVAETLVQTFSQYLIIRTNFVEKTKWPYKKAFTDRFGTYLFADDVALGIKELYECKKTGIVHLTGDKKFSMYELAKITTEDIEPMTIKEYSGPHVTMNMTLESKNWKKYQISKI